MPYNLSHDKSRAKENMTREERIDNLMSKKRNDRNEVRKLVQDGDTSIVDNLEIYMHGRSSPLKVGRDWSYTDMELFERECVDFIKFCDEKRFVPNWVGLALWLGTDSGTLNIWKNNSNSPMQIYLKRIEEVFHNFTQQKALDGQLNPLMYFFMAKNYWGLQDKTEVVHRSQSMQVIDISDQQRIINATPGIVIDGEYTEKAQISSISNETEKEDIDYQSIQNILRGANSSELEHSENTRKVPEKFQKSSENDLKSSRKVPEKFQNDTETLLKNEDENELEDYYEQLEEGVHKPFNDNYKRNSKGDNWDDDL